MIELRWFIRSGWDGPEKVLQYRVKQDMTIRAAAAGMWDNDSIARTASYAWSQWMDVPEVEDK